MHNLLWHYVTYIYWCSLTFYIIPYKLNKVIYIYTIQYNMKTYKEGYKVKCSVF
jgi:hypothetical protein